MSARDFVRAWGPTVADAVLLVLGFALDHQDVLSDWLRDWYPIIQPTGFVALGAFGGYSVARTLGRRALAKETAERDARIAKLEADLGARNRADAERARLRETFVRGIDPEQQAAVTDAWLSPGGRLDVSERPVRGLGEGIALKELLVPDGDGWARATDGAASLLDSSGDLVALVMGRKIADAAGPAHGDLARTLREMDFYTKCTLVAVWRHNGLELAWLDPDGRCLNEDPPGLDEEKVIRKTNGRLRALMSLGLVEYETVSPSNRRWHLMDDVAELLAEPELVPEGAGATADEIWSSVEDAMSGSWSVG